MAAKKVIGSNSRNPNPSLPPPTSTPIVPVPNGNGPVIGIAPTNGLVPVNSNYRFQLNPNQEHMADNYEDLSMEFPPLLLSALERHLPPHLLNISRLEKYKYMCDILWRYSTHGERKRVLSHKEYRQTILSNYQPMYKELYMMNPSFFFVPSFLEAFNSRDECIRSIMSEPHPGLYTFDMLQPHFCQMLLSEVENFEKWAHNKNIIIWRPSTINKYGVVLDDFGMKGTLDRLVEDFVQHISKVFFPDVGGLALDSHHGYVVEYGIDRDVDIAFHMDDSEVTLNVCLGKQFTGGDLLFCGIRCEKHINGEVHPEEAYEYTQSVGRAIIHHGRHRHGARATTSGNRTNLVLWCRSSVFRELKKHQKDNAHFCGDCKREKEGKLVRSPACAHGKRGACR